LPWGLSSQGSAVGAAAAAVGLLARMFIVGAVVVVIETAQSRLRFFRYQEPLAASFMLAVLAIAANQLR